MVRKGKKSGIYLALLLCLTFVAFLLLPSCNSVQESAKAQRLDSLFQQAYKNRQFNGAVLVAEKGKPIYEKALGYADTNRTPLQLNAQFSIAQATRQFTTMAMMLLQEQGKINYSDKVAKYIPGFPYPDVTIYQLMTFTDGLPYTGDLEDQYWDEEKRKTATNADVIQLIIAHQPKAITPPGKKLGWTGTNSIVMAYIIEKVSGESYPDFLDAHIFRPLKMEHTFVYNPDYTNTKIQNRAYLIRQDINGKDLHAENDAVNGLVGDVGIFSTVSDLLKWDQALYTEKLVKKATLEQAFAPAILADGTIAEDDASQIPGLQSIGLYHFGFGWDIDTLYGCKTVFHGIFPPEGGLIFRNMDKKRTVILLTNNSAQNFRFYHFKIFDRVLKILNNQPAEPLKKSIGDTIGIVYSNSGISKAIAAYHQIKQSEPDRYNFSDPMELFNLGDELLTRGKPDDALEILKLNSEELPDQFYTLYLLGRIYIMKEDYPTAKKAIEKVIKILPNAEPPRQMLKMIEAKMNGAAEN